MYKKQKSEAVKKLGALAVRTSARGIVSAVGASAIYGSFQLMFQDSFLTHMLGMMLFDSGAILVGVPLVGMLGPKNTDCFYELSDFIYKENENNSVTNNTTGLEYSILK